MKMAGYKAKGIRHTEEHIMTHLKRLIARTGITERRHACCMALSRRLEEGLIRNSG